MTKQFAPHAAKVVLYKKSTGERIERWPVDARDLLRTGDYTTDPPEQTDDAVTVDPASTDPGNAAKPTGRRRKGGDPDPASLVPGLQQQNLEHSPGVPLVAGTAETASELKPVELPQVDG